MKKILALLFVMIALCLTFTACGDEEDPITYYSVAFDSNGAERYTTREIASGSLIIEPVAPVRGGYYFTGWYSGDRLWDFEKDTVTENITLKAGWKRITYAVSFDTAGGEGTYPDALVAAGDPVAKPADPTRDGFTFLGWYLDGQSWDFDVDPVLNNMTLTAAWEEIIVPVYKVTFDSNGGTAVAIKSVLSGERASAPTPPTRSGHDFGGWTLGGVAYDFTAPVTADITLVAVWEEIIIPTYTVTFDSNGGSAVEAQHPVENTVVSRPADPTYPTSDSEIRVSSFLGWYLNGAPYDFSTPVTESITLTAKWNIEIYYKVVFEAEGDSEYPKSYILPKGETVPVLRPSRENYRFAGWNKGETPWNVTSDIPTSNMTLTAAWTPIPTYRVSFDTAGGSLVAVQTVYEGGYVSEPANPVLQSHRFDGWYSGETRWNFDTMTVTGPVTLTAKWVEQVRVVFNGDDGKTLYSKTIDKGTLAPEYPAPKKDKHRFDGWYSGDTLWNFESMAVNESVILTPRYVRQYTVSFYTDYELTLPDQIIDEGGYITRPDTPQRGPQYSFDGWYIENTDIEWDFTGDDKMAVTYDLTLVARWSIMTPPDVFN